ncbi:outer membrane protein assembly factor BamD [Motiliproteus sp.]|uniref:outer membrane protein assembly factor BamD n=1 Tax=Motiliproteus sp. TaxID=1898955 RepID=UPI003BA9AA95
MKRFVKLTLILSLSALLGACSIFGDQEEPDIPEPQLWKEASKALTELNYELAIEKLEKLESRYPFGRYSEQAQLELIWAYHKQSKPAEAVAAADRFIRLHPQHENLDYAYYLRGLTRFVEDQSLLNRFLPTDTSQRDPGAARDSFEDFSTLLNRWPTSQYAPDARKRMIFLRNQLANYEIHVARYYIKRGAFVAATNRGRYVIENFPQTQATADALAIMVAGYNELGLTELADNAKSVLDQNFPDYPGLELE